MPSQHNLSRTSRLYTQSPMKLSDCVDIILGEHSSFNNLIKFTLIYKVKLKIVDGDGIAFVYTCLAKTVDNARFNQHTLEILK